MKIQNFDIFAKINRKIIYTNEIELIRKVCFIQKPFIKSKFRLQKWNLGLKRNPKRPDNRTFYESIALKYVMAQK